MACWRALMGLAGRINLESARTGPPQQVSASIHGSPGCSARLSVGSGVYPESCPRVPDLAAFWIPRFTDFYGNGEKRRDRFASRESCKVERRDSMPQGSNRRSQTLAAPPTLGLAIAMRVLLLSFGGLAAGLGIGSAIEQTCLGCLDACCQNLEHPKGYCDEDCARQYVECRQAHCTRCVKATYKRPWLNAIAPDLPGSGYQPILPPEYGVSGTKPLEFRAGQVTVIEGRGENDREDDKSARKQKASPRSSIPSRR